MTVGILFKDQIRGQVLRILSGYCFRQRQPSHPHIYILSPWISDVQLEIDEEVFSLDTMWFGLDYGIRSINLPYALLLLKLDFGAEISIVTRPPVRENYERVEWVRNLLDFLDEIGCEISLNSELHSKLILSNDLALIGSFNLSKAALYDREEIGVSIDDLGNLDILQQHAADVVASSTPYGYTGHLHRTYSESPTITTKITRGWLYEAIVAHYFRQAIPDEHLFDEFLIDHVKTKSIYLDGVVKELALDLDAFYSKATIQYLKSERAEAEMLKDLRISFDYGGKFDIEEVLGFLRTRLARERVPRIPLRILSMPKPKD